MPGQKLTPKIANARARTSVPNFYIKESPPPPPRQKPKNDILGANFAENGTLTEYTKTI